MKAPFTVYASLGKQAKSIADELPETDKFVDLCVGSGSVFYNRPRVREETLIDYNPLIINLHRVIRDYPEALLHELPTLPGENLFSRISERLGKRSFSDIFVKRDEEFQIGLACDTYMLLYMSKRHSIYNDELDASSPTRFASYKKNGDAGNDIWEASRRLKGVNIEHHDAVMSLNKIKDESNDQVLFFASPPYMGSKYSGPFKMDLEWHKDLVRSIKAAANAGHWFYVCGGTSAFYEEKMLAIPGFRVAKEYKTYKDAQVSKTYTNTPRNRLF